MRATHLDALCKLVERKNALKLRRHGEECSDDFFYTSGRHRWYDRQEAYLWREINAIMVDAQQDDHVFAAAVHHSGKTRDEVEAFCLSK